MQMNLMDLVAAEKEDVRVVLKDLLRTCSACRLSMIHPENRGLIWRGNPDAKIAVIGEAPGDTETEMGLPLIGPSGKEWERWAKFLQLDTKVDCLLTNVVQCQPAKKKIDGRLQQQSPEKDEITTCFGSRCLRVMKAMPNLEVVMTLGWVAAKALLGGDPKARTHEGGWFYTNILPGVAVFCLVHPAYILRDPSPEKSSKVEHCLRLFKQEYLVSKKVLALAQQAKEKLHAS
jgi:uracil-DNA glycosylase family 4